MTTTIAIELLFACAIFSVALYSASLRARIPARGTPSLMRRGYHILAPIMWSAIIVAVVIFIVEYV